MAFNKFFSEERNNKEQNSNDKKTALNKDGYQEKPPVSHLVQGENINAQAVPNIPLILQLQKKIGNQAVGQFINIKEDNGRMADEKAALHDKENDTGLPEHLKARIKAISGVNTDDVKVHYNSDKPALLNAHAFTMDTDIHIAPGKEKHLAHEAWHVVQQKQNRLKPTIQIKGLNINQDAALEKEAETMGKKALNASSGSGNAFLHDSNSGHISHNIVQKADSATEYADYIRRDRTWGGYPEAHTIATYYGFHSRIYSLTGAVGAQRMILMTDIGNGDDRNLSLLWTGDHFQVVGGGGGLNGQLFNPASVVHNPEGDGNCLYEAVFYILRNGEGNVGKLLNEDPRYRSENIANMRGIAASHMEPALLSMLGDELLSEQEKDKSYEKAFVFANDKEISDIALYMYEIYKKFPPKDYYIALNGKLESVFKKRKPVSGDKEARIRTEISNVVRDINSGVVKKMAVKEERTLKVKFEEYLKKHSPYKSEPAKKRFQVDTKNCYQLINEKNIQVWLEPHQNKHQHADSMIPQLGSWKSKKGSLFASGRGLEWHRANTAVTIRNWALALGLKEGESRIPKKEPMTDGYIYDATAEMQKGVIIVSYHCNPPEDET